MRRHKHQLSNFRLLTCDLGQLVPVGLTEVLPGDSFQHSTSLMIRLSPMAAPVMHPVTVRVHHFFVPHRLIWEGAGGTGTFEDFITSGPTGNDAQTVPTYPSTGAGNDLEDYYGIPKVIGVPISALPVTGFNFIYNEYYRDQDLITERALNDTSVPFVAWEKDYFSAARPWPQKGPDVTLPIAGSAPVMGLNYDPAVQPPGSTNRTSDDLPGNQGTSFAAYMDTTDSGAAVPYVYTDLTQAEAVKVNEFRKAFALQRYAEARARYGSRYTEYLRYLGVTPSDARLDRPEYLGGGKARVNISEVLQTAPEGATPAREYGVGDLYGHGVSAMRTNRYRRFFEEHGYVHTFMSVRPKAMYMQAINRTWLRATREDFWQKELEAIGQQEIYKDEIYADPVAGRETWGYQDRYRDYRENPSIVSGEFRTTLNYWHLARDFLSAPTLNQSFVDCNPSKRIFNEQTQHSLWCMAQHRLVARRGVTRSGASRIL